MVIKMNVPKLRFNEFNTEWNEIKLSDYCTIITKGTTPSKFYNSGIRFIKIESLNNHYIDNSKCLYIDDKTHFGNLKRSILFENDILFAIAGATVGKCGIVRKINLPANTNQALSIIRLKNSINPLFVLNCLDSYNMRKYIFLNVAIGAQPNLNLEQIANFRFKIPSKIEQDKIINLINLLDKKIELQLKKIEALKLYKICIKNIIFNDEKYTETKLKYILKKWTEKNKNNEYDYVESVSNKHGFISQNEQFEDRNVASKDKSNYYVIRKNVFAYNPSRLDVGSLALKDNDLVSLVSPLYECFTTNQNVYFMLEWFDSKEFKKGTFSKFEGGVRNTLSFTNLCEINISLPSITEQDKIANILMTFNNKLIYENEKLKQLKNLKKGLIQNMFV